MNIKILDNDQNSASVHHSLHIYVMLLYIFFIWLWEEMLLRLSFVGYPLIWILKSMYYESENMFLRMPIFLLLLQGIANMNYSWAFPPAFYTFWAWSSHVQCVLVWFIIWVVTKMKIFAWTCSIFEKFSIDIVLPLCMLRKSSFVQNFAKIQFNR